MNIRRVKQGARITYFNGFYMIILGFFYIFFSRLNMSISFESRSQLWGFFLRYNSGPAFIFILFNVILGIMLISNGIVAMYLSDFILKRKEKMTWVILFLSGIISWAGLLTVSILFKNLILIILSFIGWTTFIFGMLFPIQYYLEKNYREY